jgi:hypothetical protein
MPPLRESARSGLVVDLLEDNKSVVPVGKVLNLPLVGYEMAAIHHGRIEAMFFGLDVVPVPELLVVFGEEKSERLLRLGNKVGWK